MTKVPNYKAERNAIIRAAYAADSTAETIAAMANKYEMCIRSVIELQLTRRPAKQNA